jgi:23S rRNA pseudouridine1911/1915/1917 synthase
MSHTFQVEEKEEGERLDRFLARRAGLSRSQVQKLVSGGFVVMGEKGARPALRLKRGEEVRLTVPPPAPSTLSPEAIPLGIVYEDQDVVVVDKPAGLCVHPAPGHPSGTLVNALLARYPELSLMASPRPGIVHRLDIDTSGVIMVARNEAARLFLSRELKSRRVEKKYLALVRGDVSPAEGVIEAPIGRNPGNRKKMAVVPGGREAHTGYRVLRRFEGFTLVEASPETGRTHQIRVHFAHLGHPVAGDKVYGGKSPLFKRQFLHAYRLAFRHPRDGRWLEFTSPLPPDLEEGLKALAQR